MKLQIISKKDKRSTCGESSRKYSHLHRENQENWIVGANPCQEYYRVEQREVHRKVEKKNEVRDFFNRFQSKCVVVYEKVQHQPSEPKRKL